MPGLGVLFTQNFIQKSGRSSSRLGNRTHLKSTIYYHKAPLAGLTHPSPRASRPRSWHTWRRLSGPSLRRSTPCEVAGGRNSAAVAPPAQPCMVYRALRAAAQSGSGAPHGHNPCHRPCRRPCHPLPPCLRRGRRWERPAGLACCPCWGRARGTHVICSNGLRDSNKK